MRVEDLMVAIRAFVVECPKSYTTAFVTNVVSLYI